MKVNCWTFGINIILNIIADSGIVANVTKQYTSQGLIFRAYDHNDENVLRLIIPKEGFKSWQDILKIPDNKASGYFMCYRTYDSKVEFKYTISDSTLTFIQLDLIEEISTVE